MFIVVCFVITVILHSVKAVICLFIQKTFTPEISLPKVREFFFMMKSCILHYLYMYSPWFVLVSGYACDISGRTGYPRKKNRSAGFYIPRIFNTQQSRRDLFEGFYTCTKLCREFFFLFYSKRWCTWILHCIKLKNPWLWRECSI